MAATLVPAKYPLVIQEGSRVIRKAYEELSLKILNRTGADPHLGWNNFSFLQKADFIPDMMASLKSDIWDKKSMGKVFRQSTASSMYPLLDMMLKIKTVDNRIS